MKHELKHAKIKTNSVGDNDSGIKLSLNDRAFSEKILVVHQKENKLFNAYDSL